MNLESYALEVVAVQDSDLHEKEQAVLMESLTDACNDHVIKP